MTHKVCKTCKANKPVSEFHKQGKGYRSHCKQCRKTIRLNHSNGRIGRDAERRAHLQNRYGISLEEYELLKQQQNERCAICKRKVPLVVDHCHITGTVRGLLCFNCNVGIGNLKDDVKLFRRAIEYLDVRRDSSTDNRVGG